MGSLVGHRGGNAVSDGPVKRPVATEGERRSGLATAPADGGDDERGGLVAPCTLKLVTLLIMAGVR